MKISKSPKKSLSDKKVYKMIKLANGLKALLVKQECEKSCEEEPKLKQNIAAVALCVGSGCFNDPVDVQGMSHFLEHMIFMGSGKYQKENNFDQFVSSHGGFDNAYTECEHTLFHFDIIEKHLAGALDRFSQFFISPLMSIDSMEREMEAIESEFQSNSIDDDVRVVQIYCSLINDSHPASNFVWGNLETLKHGISKEKLNERLHIFKKRNYVADKMFLCIQSSVELTRLERTVFNYFSDIPKGVENQTSQAKSSHDIFKTSFREKLFYVKSTAEKCKLLMTFLLPPMEKELKFLEYLAALIENEGAGSLIDFYMNDQLALKVKVKVNSQSFEGNSYFTFFTIEVNLTSRGFENFHHVLEGLFAFLLLLKATTLDDHKKRYTEFKDIKETLFKYRKEKSAIENVQELAVNMKYFKDEEVIAGKEVCPDFDEKVFKQIVESLNERKFNLLILSDKYPSYDKTEVWFGTEYAEVDFPSSYSKLWNERWLRNELFLPSSNTFICKNFSLVNGPEQEVSLMKYPKKIFETSTCCCFYKMDSQFKLPHGFVYVFFVSSLTEVSVSNLNMTSIFSMCVKNFLSDKLHLATIAGYNYKLNSVENGLILRLSGFSEKLLQIVDIITTSMKNLEALIDSTVFETFKKELKKNCHCCLIDGNLLNDDCRLAVIKKHHRSFHDRHSNVESLSYVEFKEFCASFIPSFKVKVLIQGNVDETCAIDITKLILANLNIRERESSEKFGAAEIFKIPLGCSYVKVKSMRHNGNNSILKNYYQVGKATMHSECLAELLVGLINEPLFDTLRSHEQLGYGVACSVKRNGGIVGFVITVEYQENKNSAHVIDEKIEEFLTNFLKKLESLTDRDFSTVKRSIVSLKLITDSDLEKEVNRNWNEVRTGENEFDRNVLEAFEIEKLTKEDAIDFYKKLFLSTKETRKLSVQVLGNACSLFRIIKSSNEDKNSHESFVNDLIKFTEKLETFK